MRMAQQSLFGTEETRALLDQLLTDSQLYTKSADYKALLDFVVRLRNFAPFNAMILQMQKPGLTYAASAHDWRSRFGRWPKDGARPLLILWPFGPVALVYDVLDTEGAPLPQDVSPFYATGPVDGGRLASFVPLMGRKGIEWCPVDAGDGRAGSIRLVSRATDNKGRNLYRIHINRNHEPAVQFATLAHELAHLFLAHLGPDSALSIPSRSQPTHGEAELEAESVSYIVCARNSVHSKSETYLKDYVSTNATIDDIDIYQVMRAAGQVESLLGLTANTRYDRPANRKR